MVWVYLFLREAKINSAAEFVKSEDTFTDVKAALKPMNKMDFDKLIVSVRVLFSVFVILLG